MLWDACCASHSRRSLSRRGESKADAGWTRAGRGDSTRRTRSGCGQRRFSQEDALIPVPPETRARPHKPRGTRLTRLLVRSPSEGSGRRASPTKGRAGESPTDSPLEAQGLPFFFTAPPGAAEVQSVWEKWTLQLATSLKADDVGPSTITIQRKCTMVGSAQTVPAMHPRGDSISPAQHTPPRQGGFRDAGEASFPGRPPMLLCQVNMGMVEGKGDSLADALCGTCVDCSDEWCITVPSLCTRPSRLGDAALVGWSCVCVMRVDCGAPQTTWPSPRFSDAALDSRGFAVLSTAALVSQAGGGNTYDKIQRTTVSPCGSAQAATGNPTAAARRGAATVWERRLRPFPGRVRNASVLQRVRSSTRPFFNASVLQRVRSSTRRSRSRQSCGEERAHCTEGARTLSCRTSTMCPGTGSPVILKSLPWCLFQTCTVNVDLEPAENGNASLKEATDRTHTRGAKHHMQFQHPAAPLSTANRPPSRPDTGPASGRPDTRPASGRPDTRPASGRP
eukprot:gene6386-biopygen11875